MSDKKRTTEETFDSWAQDTYQTGATQPPKSRSGLIALLLGAVIFLSGVFTSLGLMNFRLLWQQDPQEENNTPVVFARSGMPEAASYEASQPFSLGFSGQPVSQFWNLYEDLPQGIYITEVRPNTSAAAKGIQTGDILLSVNGTPVRDCPSLTQLLAACPSGDKVKAVIFRNGKYLPFLLVMD